MDESVLKGMTKWPNVPSVYGWLSLDRRGNWLIKGERVGNRTVTEFIGRNYASDERGRWYFQNGPQRVYVTLACTPFVLSTAGVVDTFSLHTHTGRVVDKVSGVWLDGQGGLVLRWAHGVGIVSDRDLGKILDRFTNAKGEPLAAEDLENALDPDSSRRRTGFWLDYGGKLLPVGRIDSGQLAQKFGFDPDPRPAPGEPEC